MSFKNELNDILHSSIFGNKISNDEAINILNNLKQNDNLDYLFLAKNLDNNSYVCPKNLINLIQDMDDPSYNKTLITEITKKFIKLIISKMVIPDLQIPIENILIDIFMNEFLYLRHSYKIIKYYHVIFRNVIDKNINKMFTQNYIYDNFLYKLYKCSSFENIYFYKVFLNININNISIGKLENLLSYSLCNYDDRVYKSIVKNIKEKYPTKTDVNITYEFLINKSPDKYKMKKLNYLSKNFDFTKKIDEIVNNIILNDYSNINKLFQFYDLDHLSSEYLCNFITRNNFIKLFTHNNYLENMISPNLKRLTFIHLCIKIFDSYNNEENFTIDDINFELIDKFDIKNTEFEYEFKTKFIDTHSKSFNSNLLKILSLTKFFDEETKKYFSKHIVEDRFNQRYPPDIKTIIFYIPYINYLDIDNLKSFQSSTKGYKYTSFFHLLLLLNKIKFYLSVHIRKKRKLNRFFNNIQRLNLIKDDLKTTSDCNNKRDKFSKIPPYHIYPNQFNSISTELLIKEKVDGVSVNELPTNIYPHMIVEKLKAEFYEDLNIHFIFDIDLDDTSYEERYLYLRKLHPYTKNTNLKIISTFNELMKSIQEERAIIKKMISEHPHDVCWYPKACWKILDINLISNELNKFLNGNSIYHRFICNDFYSCDGLVIKTPNNVREIKLKPKQLLTIDLKFLNGKFCDNEGNMYDFESNTEDSLNIEEDTIWRLYPSDDYKTFIPKEFRFDKKYPNPKSVVLSVMKLVNSTFRNDKYNKIYFTINNFKKNNDWTTIVNNSNKIFDHVLKLTDFQPNKIVLDLGCGRSKILKQNIRFLKYFGIDFDEGVLFKTFYKNNNRNYQNINFNYIDLSKRWVQKNSWSTFDFSENYDYIFSINSLMHFCTDDFWHQINTILNENNKFIFNILNDSLPSGYKNRYKFGESYIYREKDITKYYFENVHSNEMEERFINEDIINKYLRKYNLKILEKFTPDFELHKYYTWYIISK
jgi:cyclopropane fatty-acyl-phospholipid synthase-like methyltransferase